MLRKSIHGFAGLRPIEFGCWEPLKTLGLAIGVVVAPHCWPALADQIHPADQPLDNPPTAILSTAQDETGTESALSALAVPAVPAKLRALGGEVSWSTEIDYTVGRIFNPRTGGFEEVELRSYKGPGVDPNFPFVAPTVNLNPGETFRLTLDNQLPKEDPSCPGSGDTNTPHCFNATNMHSHGLWVSPTGNSDNVLIRINPGVKFTYEYNIPVDHPAGTFWYHPHLHGSTALQVSSGMAGALIIHGDRLPTADSTGDVDTLLKDADGDAFPERVLLFQQIPYACRNPAGEIKRDSDGLWVCDPGDVGTIEKYDQFGPRTWRRSGRYTSINGRVVPTFDTAIAGRIERWRSIHAGVRDSIKLRFQKYSAPERVVASATAYTAATPDAQEAFVDDNCIGDPLPQLSLAVDGLTRDKLVRQRESLLHPGYREDLLMVFPEPGTYCIIDGDAPSNENASQQAKGRQLLGFVRVGPGPGTGGLTVIEHVKQQLIATARRFMPEGLRERIVSDLEQRLGLGAFEPHRSLMAVKPQGRQTLGFVIRSGPLFQIGELDDQGELVNPQSYDPGRIDRNLALGSIDDWELRSFLGGHPFHIHVNPFQIVEVLDPEGNDVSGYEEGNASPYARLRGAWKDTLFVTQTDDNKPYRIRIRTHYRRYIGDFVLHCHILDHEDQGMMQNVRIALPDGRGGLAAAHH